MHPERSRPLLSPRSNVPSSAGAAPTLSRDDCLVNQVVASIGELSRAAALDFALSVGCLIIDQLYGGDLNAWRSRGTKAMSFRKLAKHPELPMSPGALYRSVAIYELSARLGCARWQSLSASHLRLVLPLPPQEQSELLARADEERWTLSRLEREVVLVRTRYPGKNLKGGRRRSSALLSQLRNIERALAVLGDPPFGAEPSPENAQAALASLERIRARFAEVETQVEHHLCGVATPQDAAPNTSTTRSQ